MTPNPSQPTESSSPLTFTQHHAFIIGIDKYQHVSSLQTAVNDASTLAEILEKQHHFLVHPPLLDATGSDIRRLLQDTLPKLVREDDRVVFYFAGHGIAGDGEDGPAGYIVPADAAPPDQRTYIPMEELQKTLDALPCRHLLLILDCCFSGAFKWSSRFRAMGSLIPRRIYKERFDRFILDPAWQVITSAAYDQKALDVLKGEGKAIGDRGVQKPLDGDNLDHSPFALALYKGLSGEADVKVGQEGDGLITATELYSFIRDQIEPATLAESQKLRQTPGFFPLRKHDKGEFIFLHPRHRLNLPPIPKRSPYKGLQSFDEADKDLFYGRDRVVKELRQKIQGNKLMAVSGASGTGKSSVVKAGLLPALREVGYRVLPVIRPGANPVAALQKALVDAGVIDSAESMQGAVPPTLTERLGEQKTVLIVDQYEELITRCSSAAERDQFVALLKNLLDGTPPEALRVIVTVRADFEPQLNEGELKQYWVPGRCTVPPFNVEEWKEVILMPTMQEVLIFDPPDLVDEIIQEVVQSPGALPLLSYTLSELYEAYRKSGRQDRALKRKDYDTLGGVMGALRTKADAVYNSLDASHQDTMRRMMLRMVSVEGELAGKRVMMDDLDYADATEDRRVQEVIEQLVDARLIVKGKDYVEPAHDALVRAWKRLLDWVREIGEDKITLYSKVKVPADDYARSHNVKFLWNNSPHLDVLRQEQHNPQQWLNEKEILFIQESVQRKKRLSRIVRATTAAVLVALSALTVWALLNAQRANLEARRLRADVVANRASAALGSDNTLAVRLAGESYAIVEEAPLATVQRVLSAAFHTLHGKTIFYSAILQHQDEVTAAAFSPTRERLLTASKDGTATLWDGEGDLLTTFASGNEKIQLAVFSPSGKMIFTSTQEGRSALWDAEGNSLGVTFNHSKRVNSAVFSPDERLVLTACADDTARLWNVDGNVVARLGHPSQVFAAVFDPLGERVITACADGVARIWNWRRGVAGTVGTHRRQVNRAVLSPDGKLVLTASRDGEARLWTLEGKLVRRFPHTKDQEVFTAIFDSAGQRILTASEDSSARLWDLQGNLVQALRHGQKVNSATFSADGRNIVTASADSTAMLWNRQGMLLAILKHQGEVTRAEFSPDRRQILTASKDGTARLWNLRDIDIVNFDTPAQFASFSSDNERILTSGNDGTARVWDRQGRLADSLQVDRQIKKAVSSPVDERVLLVLDGGIAGLWNPGDRVLADTLLHEEQEITSAAFSLDGKFILTVASKTARLWDVANAGVRGRSPRIIGAPEEVNSAVFISPGGTLLTASDDGFARLWDTRGQLLDSLDHQGIELKSAYFSPKTGRLLTNAEDGLSRIWNEQRRVLDSLQTGGVETAVFSPTGEHVLMTPSRGSPVMLWDLSARHIDSLIHPGKAFVKLAIFSPDGSQILTGATDGVVRLWNLQGEVVAELDNHQHEEITSIAFSPDGRVILSCALNNTLRQWWTPRTIFEWLKDGDVYRLTEKQKAEFKVGNNE